MGCDIHLFAEYKKNGKWVPDESHKVIKENYGSDTYSYLEQLPVGGDRDYVLFGFLANVRVIDLPNALDPLGIPMDLSKKIYDHYKEYLDGHSHSYIHLDDLKIMMKEYYKYLQDEDLQYKDERSDMEDVIEYCQNKIEKSNADSILLDEPSLAIEDCRIVFWFDN